MKAAEMVFSRAEVRLMDERGTKNAASAAFNSNDGDPGGTRTHDTKLKRLVL